MVGRCLKDTPIKVNSACPGSNATDLVNNQGAQHPSDGAKVVVRAATLPADGPTGSFFDVSGLWTGDLQDLSPSLRISS